MPRFPERKPAIMLELTFLVAQQITVTRTAQGPIFEHFLHSMPWFAWVAIVAIISGSVTTIVKDRIRHRERMEMIRMGMHPDAPNQPAKFPPAEI
jgi:uncharacterized membrane protein (DUF106 family)